MHYVDTYLVNGSQEIDPDIVFSVRHRVALSFYLEVETLLDCEGKSSDFD
jgi:hypothetical protein